MKGSKLIGGGGGGEGRENRSTEEKYQNSVKIPSYSQKRSSKELTQDYAMLCQKHHRNKVSYKPQPHLIALLEHLTRNLDNWKRTQHKKISTYTNQRQMRQLSKENTTFPFS